MRPKRVDGHHECVPLGPSLLVAVAPCPVQLLDLVDLGLRGGGDRL
ncbi:MAG: hypothetical protein ACRD29_09260 [Acidimicrobiales bacterium]